MRDYKDYRADEGNTTGWASLFWTVCALVILIPVYAWMDSRDAPQQYECAPVMEMSMPIQDVTRI